MTAVPNPWTALGNRDDLVLVRAPIAERGRYYHHLRSIVVRAGMLLVEERSTLWHELHHADRGDTRCAADELEARQEAACERAAARRAIPIRALLDAARWARGHADAADALKVTPDLLEVRLQHLHPSERHHLRRVINERGDQP